MEYFIIILLAILAVIEVFTKNKMSKWITLSIIILLIIIALLRLLQQSEKIKKEKTNQYSGELRSNSELIFSIEKNKVIPIEIGDSGTIFSIAYPKSIGSEPMNLFHWISHFRDNALEVILEDGKLKVSTTIRDKSGSIVAEIFKNNWKAAHQPVSWDRNFSDSALEVKNRDGKIVLQIILAKERIKFQGTLFDKSGNGISIASIGPGQGAEFIQCHKNENYYRFTEKSLKSIKNAPKDLVKKLRYKIGIESCGEDNFMQTFRYIFQNGKLIKIKDEELSSFKEQILKNSITDFGIDIKPIFKYPSELYPGEYVDNAIN